MAGSVAPPNGGQTNGGDGKNYTIPLAIVTLLFFMWGFITCMNDILIPKFREVFDLTAFQAMWVQTAFFASYFLVSLIYFLLSVSGNDLIAKHGYKNAIIVGLLVAALGCFLFYPAAIVESYGLFLGALFVLASGVTILQMGANPYVSLLGSPEGSSSRLNMTQAFNSLGTTIAPIIGGILIFQCVSDVSGGNPLDSVKMPYIVLSLMLLAIAVLIKYSDLPVVNAASDESSAKGKGAFHYPHLVLGVICIFMYVGGEVTIGSTIINYLGLENVAGLTHAQADKYLAVYWGGAMIGRFFASIFLNENVIIKEKLVPLISIFVFSIFLAIFLTNKELILSMIIEPCEGGEALGWNFNSTLIFMGVVVLNVVAFLIGSKRAGVTLGVFAAIVCALLVIVSIGSGAAAIWSVLVIGLFNSIMFPSIFTLAIKGLGIDTAQGSSLLVMAIVGGAIVPLFQGAVADWIGLQLSFIVPLICYLYIAYYGFVGSKPKNVEV